MRLWPCNRVEKTSRELELGIRRRRIDALEKDYAWLPLMKDVSALEIRYFDPRVNAWIERWPASEDKPLLVQAAHLAGSKQSTL